MPIYRLYTLEVGLKKFEFKLQTVLKLRQKALDDAMLELARISKVLQDTQNEKQLILDTKSNLSLKLTTVVEGEILDIEQIQTGKNYIMQLDTKIKQKNQLIEQIKIAVNSQQKKVQEALKERDILTKLEEKQKQNFYKEFLHKEMTELDDISISRYKVG
ncbi:MAG: flagellar export protein FliJ [Candidatus Gastranaerophilales bacterium]|nr:flagellar export protein FliJ [Candidatus Gastranaerophilales bacterium]